MPRSILEQLQYEDRREAYEKRRLEEMTDVAMRKMRKATPAQLKAAAALKHHESRLGFIGRLAEHELKRRGLL